MIFESKRLNKSMFKFIRFVLLGLVVSIASMASSSYACCGTCGKESSCGNKDNKKKDSDQKE